MAFRFPIYEDFAEGKEKIAVIGLGYVGLPLAVMLAEKFRVIGFDVNPERVEELRRGFDRTGEVETEKLKRVSIKFTNDEEELSECRLIIITVPTPIDSHKIPDLTAVKAATKIVAERMKPGTVVVYESTVYPGVTEEVCVPILEKVSGLRYMEEFKVG